MAKRTAASPTLNPLRAFAPSRDISPASREGAKALSDDTVGGMPDGWVDVTLADICDINPRKPSVGEVAAEAEVTFVPMPAVDAEARAITNPVLRTFEQVRRGYTSFRDEDVILAKITPCFENGKAAICRGLQNGLGFGSTEFHVLRANGVVLPEYVYRFVQQDSFLRDGEANMTGSVGQKRVPAAWVQTVRIPLPPLAEQRRIVARVEALLGRVQAARARLAKVPAVLKRFRQSVLAAACSGELTADLSAIRNTDDSRLPEGWTTMSVASVCESVVDCPHSTPKWSDGGIACLRTTNFRVGKLDLDELRYVSEETYKARVARLVPRAGDVVYSREGGILGIACTIPEGLQACLGQRMMLMRPGQRVVSTFLMHILNSPPTLARVRELTGGTASPHLNVGDVKAFSVPLPSLPVQHEIVRRVEALFALADKIEARVALATERVERTTQAILAKAFRGELVPTEAELARQQNRDYEPATALLERIRAERDNQSEISKLSRESTRRKAKPPTKRQEEA